MEIEIDVPLKYFTTMRIGGRAKYFAVITDENDLIEAIDWANENKQKILVIGGGSNIIFTDEGYDGLVLKNMIKGFESSEEDDKTIITAGAGMKWDDLVEKSVDMNLTGIEAMSAIPGTVGATPVQNVGAYGQEIAETFISLRAYDLLESTFKTITREECAFGYRSSIFKQKEHGRYIICSVTLGLKKGEIEGELYRSLANYFQENNIVDRSPEIIRKAVIAIRSQKLPDPDQVANTGSFFKNPIIDRHHRDELLKKYPDMPSFEVNEGFKIPAGWLLEKSNFKDYQHLNGMGTHKHHALVLVNLSAKSYDDIKELVSHIQKTIKEKFDIILDIEPEIINK